jgi:hypothetical protein
MREFNDLIEVRRPKVATCMINGQKNVYCWCWSLDSDSKRQNSSESMKQRGEAVMGG